MVGYKRYEETFSGDMFIILIVVSVSRVIHVPKLIKYTL